MLKNVFKLSALFVFLVGVAIFSAGCGNSPVASMSSSVDPTKDPQIRVDGHWEWRKITAGVQVTTDYYHTNDPEFIKWYEDQGGGGPHDGRKWLNVTLMNADSKIFTLNFQQLSRHATYCHYDYTPKIFWWYNDELRHLFSGYAVDSSKQKDFYNPEVIYYIGHGGYGEKCDSKYKVVFKYIKANPPDVDPSKDYWEVEVYELVWVSDMIGSDTKRDIPKNL